jgi:lactobin A/cerein 7B family class IIb bacteriocin
MIAVNDQARPVNIAELSVGELEEVNGGILFLPLAGAVLATTVQFSFVAGIFAGSHER